MEGSKMAIIDISIVPVGTATPSVSRFVADAVKILQNEPDIKYQLTPMNTVIEGDLEHLLSLAKKMHDSAFNSGIQRVVTTLRIDERRDKPLTMAGKMKSVKEKLE
jgi:uncharacterized protein (TIGR00106 family)